MRIDRGATVRLQALGAGADATPDSVTFSLDYPGMNRSRTQVDVAGAANGDDWEANWDSSVAYPGTVFVSVVAAAGGIENVDDGEFELVSNRANLNPVA